MTTLTEIEWEAPLLEPTQDPGLAQYVRATFGVVPPLAPYYYACPWVVRAMVALEGSEVALAHIDRRTVELVELVVSQDNACRYCYAVTRAVLKMHGFSERRIRQLESDLLSAEIDPRLRLVLDFARRVSRASPLPSPADVAAVMAAGFTPSALKEIIFVAATTVFFNRLATLLAVPTAGVERLDRSAAMRAAFAVTAWLGRLRFRRSVVPDVEWSPGPYAYLVDALSGLPIATTLGRVLDDAWASPALPRRTRAFLFAVVARGLGCPLSEQEAGGVLVAEGVDPETTHTALAHLAADGLDTLEGAAIPFARETIWCRPAQIQRRARALRQQFTHAQFLDLVGTVSLANALCRLSLVLLPH